MFRLMAVLVAVLGGSLWWAGGVSVAENASPDRRAEGDSLAQPLILRVDLANEVISPGISRFISRALREAEARNAECLIITLDTPGGLLESTRQIVKQFLQTPVCVVVYVSPTGARAASAGVFITMAAHVAAMAPGTTIGAARPVSLGGAFPLGPRDHDQRDSKSSWSPRTFFQEIVAKIDSVNGSDEEVWGFFHRDKFENPLELFRLAPPVWQPFGGIMSDLPKPRGIFPATSISHDSWEDGYFARPWPKQGIVRGMMAQIASAEDTSPPGKPTEFQEDQELENPKTSSAGPEENLSREVSTEGKLENGEVVPAQKPADKSGAREENRSAEKSVSPLEEKIINDTVSWAQALAQQRGRNAEWIAQAVRESVSVTAQQAVGNNVVDLLAKDFDELLERLDGRVVKLPQGEKILRTKGARVEKIEMWWGERILSIISHPEVAFLLLIFGIYGVMYELFSPGWGVPGTVGVICLLLGFFGLSVLPVNYLGLALIVVAISLFIAEAYVTSFGLLTLAGVTCMIFGGLMLIESPPGFTDVSVQLVVGVTLATALVMILIIGAAIRAHRHRVLTGDESLVGRVVQAKTDFRFQDGHYVGKVFLDGEWWEARSSVGVGEGESCRIVRRDGLSLWVEPASTPETRPPASA